MDNITIGQIASALGTLGVIVGAITGVIVFVKKLISNCYNTKVAVKFTEIDGKFKELNKKITEIDERLKYVEEKRIEYERELGDSKKERGILMKGELSALKILRTLVDESKLDKEEIAGSINEIEKYVMEKSH